MKKEMMIITTLVIMVGLLIWMDQIPTKLPIHTPYPTPLPAIMYQDTTPTEVPPILIAEAEVC